MTHTDGHRWEASPRRSQSGTGVVLFTRDLRLSDHPALASAVAEHRGVVPAFVFDEAILASSFNRPNRTGFLLECLTDLDASLRGLGAALVVRRGDWVTEAFRLAAAGQAKTIHVSDDVSRYARTRLDRLERMAACAGVEVRRYPGVSVVPPGSVRPAGGDHYQVFTPYYRRWRETAWRALARRPRRVVPAANTGSGPLPRLGQLTGESRSPEVARGGETVAQKRLAAWLPGHLGDYGDRRDDLAGDATSRLSAYLHLGCLSPREAAETALKAGDGEPFLRQLCWRDFYLQILAARPGAAWSDYRQRGDVWDDDPEALGAWRQGNTGFPVVDAAMRQLQREGFMHNRARMIVASFLTKDLYLDWREGARHFLDLLVDGDVANNNLNWQWTAGTGVDTNPHRIFNPTMQGRRFDPDGEYIRRYVPELAHMDRHAIHDPDPAARESTGYPPPIVNHREAISRYRALRRSRP